MKVFGVVVLLLSACCWVYGEQVLVTFEKELNDAIKEKVLPCVPEGSELRDFMQIVEQGKFREDDVFKQFVYCGFKETGYSNEDGSINARKSAAVFPDSEVVYKVIVECAEKKGDNPVENTWSYFKCFQNKSPYLFTLQ